MDISLQKRISARHRVMLAGLGVLGCCVLACLMFASASSAAVPGGNDCVASEGKISGRGSTYQTVLQKDISELYTADFCGAVAEQPAVSEPELGGVAAGPYADPAGTNMVAYNYAAAENAGSTGSGAGLKAISCRTDAFTGTDNPYTVEEIEKLQNEKKAGEFGGSACSLSFTPPYAPTAAGNKFPSSGDTLSSPQVMSFPVGGSAVSVLANFGTAGAGKTCEGSAVPTELKLNGKELSRLFGGEVITWSDSELAANNPQLSTDKCKGKVTRVVRQDKSGTTNIFKQYLIAAEPPEGQRTGQTTCASGKTWKGSYFKENKEWPGRQQREQEEKKETVVSEGTCSPIVNGPKSGNPEEIKKLKETEGGIGYADLPQAVAEAKTFAVTAVVENGNGTGYSSPKSNQGANCSYSSVGPPSGGVSNAVGLSSEYEKTWANNGSPNEEDVADLGPKYPICGLTWDLVDVGLSKESPVALTTDQKRTLYSYFTFLLSSTVQQDLSNLYYAPLPVAWVQELREGFQENF